MALLLHWQPHCAVAGSDVPGNCLKKTCSTVACPLLLKGRLLNKVHFQSKTLRIVHRLQCSCREGMRCKATQRIMYIVQHSSRGRSRRAMWNSAHTLSSTCHHKLRGPADAGDAGRSSVPRGTSYKFATCTLGATNPHAACVAVPSVAS